MLFAIPCTFKINQYGERFKGIAICSDPDTPVTFIHSTGMPCIEGAVWNYELHHHQPWAELRIG